MKKIVSMLMVFVAVMAFSGLTMATPVSAYSIKDKGSKIVTSGDNQYHYVWYLKYYTKNHVKLYFSYKLGKGVNSHKITFVTELKRISYHRLKMTYNGYVDAYKVSSSHRYWKTSKTAYQWFESQKSGMIKYYMS